MGHLLHRAALASVCLVIIVAALPAFAGHVPPVGYQPVGNSASVTINNCQAVVFEKPNAGLTPLQRAKLTAERLTLLASGGWRAITVQTVGSTRAQVVANGRVICIATPDDAKAAKTTAKSLAQTWAANMKRLFEMPPLTVTPKQVVVPENENRSVSVGGGVTGPLEIIDQNPTVAISSLHPTSRAIVIKGLAVGSSTVEVKCDGYTETVGITVKRYAGKLVAPGYAEVTGEPAKDSLIKTAASRAVSTVLSLEPGATASVGAPKTSGSSLPRGEKTRVFVPIKVQGPNLLPTELAAPVDVVNLPLVNKLADNLFYSNNPERITKTGTLFTGKLLSDERTRLFFHHQNMSGQKVRLLIELINAEDTTATVQAISGISTPLVDTVVVGYLAGMDFLRDYSKQAGLVHRIPARSRIIVYADNLDPVKTASGIIDLRQLSGGNVYVRVVAASPSVGMIEGETYPVTDAGIPTSLSEEVFDWPLKELDVTHKLGGQWSFVRIGKEGITDTAKLRELQGDYGVIYQIKMQIENPTSEERTAQVLFEPTAGPASGIFVIDEQIIGVKIVNPPKEFLVTRVKVPAGKTKAFTITTVPLGGSAYPAMLIVR